MIRKDVYRHTHSVLAKTKKTAGLTRKTHKICPLITYITVQIPPIIRFWGLTSIFCIEFLDTKKS